MVSSLLMCALSHHICEAQGGQNTSCLSSIQCKEHHFKEHHPMTVVQTSGSTSLSSHPIALQSSGSRFLNSRKQCTKLMRCVSNPAFGVEVVYKLADMLSTLIATPRHCFPLVIRDLNLAPLCTLMCLPVMLCLLRQLAKR